MNKKLLTLLSFSLLLSACSPEQNNNPEELNMKLAEKESSGQPKATTLRSSTLGVPKETVSSNNKKGKEPSPFGFKKYDFSKDIPTVFVSEINNHSLKTDPESGIASTKAFYHKDNKILYIYNNAEKVSKKTKLIIIEDFGNYDELLYHHLYSSKKKYFSSRIIPINNKYVDNSNRFYLNKKYKIKHIGDGLIEFTFDNQVYKIKPGKKKTLKVKHGEKDSKIIVKNLGLLDSMKNIEYEAKRPGKKKSDKYLSGDFPKTHKEKGVKGNANY